jgi:hypothetical protein
MLAQGKPRNAWAVIEAQIEFIKLFKQFKPDRTKNLDLTTEKNPIGLLNFWLIWQVYINKKKKYSDF